MNIINKILNYILGLLMITLLLSFFITTTNVQNVVLSSGEEKNVIKFDEENIIKYSKEYYKDKYRESGSNLHYIIYNGGYEKGKSYCIVKIKSKENIKAAPEEYLLELKVYDDGNVIEVGN